MQEYGSIIAQIVTSAAQIPVAGATLTISRKLPDGGQELLAVRMSDYDGFTEPFELPTPPASDSQTRQTAEVPYALVDLRGELAGRRDHERVRALAGSAGDPLQRGQREGCGLARARLRGGDDVFALKHVGDGSGLDRRGVLEAEGVHPGENLLV